MFRMVNARSIAAGAVLLFVLHASQVAQAHVVLVDPGARTADDDLTEDPCGGIPAGESVATYAAGSNTEITIDLRVRHVPSLSAVISFDDFATRTELAMVPTPESGIYKMTVPLPVQALGPAILQVTDGTYVSCADITLSEEAPFAINAGLNDAWYFPGTDGQGFLIMVYPEIPLLFLAWFTYDTERPPEDTPAMLGEPGHRWFTAAGPFEGNRAILDITVTQGGVFDMAEPRPVNSDPGAAGSMEVVFENCSRGVVKYDMPQLGLVGEIPIQRIVEDNVALCEALGDP
ncbi:MAG: hypothetical protein ACYTHJ_21505 [Planctomycetota bacterium]|jgi:hypothetical protein